MTWSEMHIGIDLGLQILNSNLFNKLEPQGKDYFLNRVIGNMVSEQSNLDIKDTSNSDSYNDIKLYSSLLQPLIKIQQLDKTSSVDGYDSISLPKDISPVISGKLYNGRTYKVIIAGTTDLTSYGAASNPAVVGATFTCNIPTLDATALIIGCKYRILTVSGSTYTTVGAINNMVDTEFIATDTTAGGTGTVQPLDTIPSWDGITSLDFVSSDSLYEFISSYSNVDYSQEFSIGALKKGVTYKIVTGGTIVGLTAFGSSSNTVESGYMFTCTVAGTPTWSTSGVSMIATKTIVNRLVKVQDIQNFLKTSYGNSITSPLSTMSDGKLLVYHDNKITINTITIVYARQFTKIDSQNNIDCELPVNYHGKIVDNTVQFIMAYTGNPNYQAVLNENK